MVLGIISFIFSLIGIVGYFNHNFTFAYIALALSLIENIIGRITGQSKTMQFLIISCLLGWIIIGDFKLGVAIGACFETVILFIGGTIMMLLFLKKNK